MATSLEHKSDFNRLWFGQTVSTMGDRISRIALPTIAVLTLHGGVLQVGIIGALSSLPFLLFGLFAGVWTDRLAKRTIMIVADVGRMIVMGLVPIAYELHFLSEGLLYAVAAVAGSLSVFFQIAYQSYLPHLAGRQGIAEGQQKLTVTRSGATFVGSALGGFLMQVLGNALAVAVDAASFLASLLGLLAIRHRESIPQRNADKDVLGEMRGGFGTLIGDLRLRFLMLTTTIVNLAIAIASALVLVYAYKSAGLNQGEVGATFAAGAVGLTIGGVFARKISAKLTLSGSLMACVCGVGVAILIVPVAGTRLALAALTVCQFLVGLASTVFGVNVMSLVMTITPMEMLGRVSGTSLTVIWGSATFGGVIAAGLGSILGLRTALVASGVVAIASVSFILFTPALRAVRELPRQPGRPQAGPPPAEKEDEQVSAVPVSES